jgi:hypothetical protein
VKPDVLTHYCITREDLPHGIQAAQIIHAAGESSPGNLPPHTYAIALTTRDERELSELSYELFRAGISHRRIIENDAPWTGQLMAIGIKPMFRSELRKHLSGLRLLR